MIDTLKCEAKLIGSKLGMLVLGVLAFLATTIVVDTFIGLDGRTVQGNAVVIASAILVGAAMLTKPLCEQCTTA